MPETTAEIIITGVCAALDGKEASGSAICRANPDCICPTAMAAMFCMTGHMLECHYPLHCEDARCDHYRREVEGSL